jgi:hypothetical protein
MAKQASVVWEVRATGSDSNGGGFDPLVLDIYSNPISGTDYSQQDSPQYTFGDVISDGTTTITSVTGFSADMIGNGINIGGAVYIIMGLPDTFTATVSDAVPSSAGAGQTGKIGGAHANPNFTASVTGTSNKIYVKAKGSTPDYTINTYIASANSPSGAVIGLPENATLEGYVTTRGDGTIGCVTIKIGSIVTPWVVFVCSEVGNKNYVVKYLTLDSNGSTYGQYCLYDASADEPMAIGVIVKSASQFCFYRIASIDCVADNSALAPQTGVGFIQRCQNRCKSINCGVGFLTCYMPVDCIAVSCREGFTGYYGANRCIAYNCTGSGFILDQNRPLILSRCIAEGCGIHGYFDNSYYTLYLDNCFSYNNTSGNSVPNAIGSPTTLAASPFVSASTGNFTLKSVTAAKAVASPFVANTNFSLTDYSDAGAVQHQDSGGGGSIIVMEDD